MKIEAYLIFDIESDQSELADPIRFLSIFNLISVAKSGVFAYDKQKMFFEL